MPKFSRSRKRWIRRPKKTINCLHSNYLMTIKMAIRPIVLEGR